MADTTTSKGITILDPDLYYDVNKINANFQKLSDGLGAIVCTSTTRPSTNLYDGMTLWETDTRRFVVRVSATWVPVPQRSIVADFAARAAIVTPYDGMMIYRQDCDWHEAFDGAAWRVVGTAHVASTSARDTLITHPYNGQICVTTDTGRMWVRQGGVWIAMPPLVPPIFQGRQTVAQPLTSGNAIEVTFTTEDKDNVNGHDNVTNPARYTAQVAGTYKLSGGVAFTANASGIRTTDWVKNGTQIPGGDSSMPSVGAGAVTRLTARTIFVDLAVNDYVTLRAFQDSGITFNTFTNAVVQSTMTVEFVTW